MTDKTAVASVYAVMAITIALEVLLAVFDEQSSYAGRPLDPSTQVTLFWTLVVLATVAVIVLLGPTRLSTWFLALVFVVPIFLGSFFVGQVVLSHYIYNRDFTYLSSEPRRQLAAVAMRIGNTKY